MANEAGVVRLTVVQGVLLQAPVWEPHFRGSNWMAIIGVDPSMPGGLSRRFLQRGKGDCLYVLEQLALFDPVEFAADYVSATNHKRRTRWFGVIVAKTSGYLLIEKCDTGMKAILRSVEARESKVDQVNALAVEREAFLEKVAKIEAEVSALGARGESSKESIP